MRRTVPPSAEIQASIDNGTRAWNEAGPSLARPSLLEPPTSGTASAWWRQSSAIALLVAGRPCTFSTGLGSGRRSGKAEDLHYRYSEKHAGNADQPIARHADREAAANANKKKNGGQEDREAHVLVRRSRG